LNPDDGALLILGIIQSLVLRALLSNSSFILLEDGERLLELQLSGFSNRKYS
jgi:hypothetical protein